MLPYIGATKPKKKHIIGTPQMINQWVDMNKQLSAKAKSSIPKIKSNNFSDYLKVCRLKQIPEFYSNYFILYVSRVTEEDAYRIIQNQTKAILSQQSYYHVISNIISERIQCLEQLSHLVNLVQGFEQMNRGRPARPEVRQQINDLLKSARTLPQLQAIQNRQSIKLGQSVTKLRKKTQLLVNSVKQWRSALHQICNSPSLKRLKIIFPHHNINCLLVSLNDIEFVCNSFIFKQYKISPSKNPFLLIDRDIKSKTQLSQRLTQSLKTDSDAYEESTQYILSEIPISREQAKTIEQLEKSKIKELKVLKEKGKRQDKEKDKEKKLAKSLIKLQKEDQLHDRIHKNESVTEKKRSRSVLDIESILLKNKNSQKKKKQEINKSQNKSLQIKNQEKLQKGDDNLNVSDQPNKVNSSVIIRGVYSNKNMKKNQNQTLKAQNEKKYLQQQLEEAEQKNKKYKQLLNKINTNTNGIIYDKQNAKFVKSPYKPVNKQKQQGRKKGSDSSPKRRNRSKDSLGLSEEMKSIQAWNELLERKSMSQSDQAQDEVKEKKKGKERLKTKSLEKSRNNPELSVIESRLLEEKAQRKSLEKQLRQMASIRDKSSSKVAAVYTSKKRKAKESQRNLERSAELEEIIAEKELLKKQLRNEQISKLKVEGLLKKSEDKLMKQEQKIENVREKYEQQLDNLKSRISKVKNNQDNTHKHSIELKNKEVRNLYKNGHKLKDRSPETAAMESELLKQKSEKINLERQIKELMKEKNKLEQILKSSEHKVSKEQQINQRKLEKYETIIEDLKKEKNERKKSANYQQKAPTKQKQGLSMYNTSPANPKQPQEKINKKDPIHNLSTNFFKLPPEIKKMKSKQRDTIPTIHQQKDNNKDQQPIRIRKTHNVQIIQTKKTIQIIYESPKRHKKPHKQDQSKKIQKQTDLNSQETLKLKKEKQLIASKLEREENRRKAQLRHQQHKKEREQQRAQKYQQMIEKQRSKKIELEHKMKNLKRQIYAQYENKLYAQKQRFNQEKRQLLTKIENEKEQRAIKEKHLSNQMKFLKEMQSNQNQLIRLLEMEKQSKKKKEIELAQQIARKEELIAGIQIEEIKKSIEDEVRRELQRDSDSQSEADREFEQRKRQLQREIEEINNEKRMQLEEIDQENQKLKNLIQRIKKEEEKLISAIKSNMQAEQQGLNNDQVDDQDSNQEQEQDLMDEKHEENLKSMQDIFKSRLHVQEEHERQMKQFYKNLAENPDYLEKSEVQNLIQEYLEDPHQYPPSKQINVSRQQKKYLSNQIINKTTQVHDFEKQLVSLKKLPTFIPTSQDDIMTSHLLNLKKVYQKQNSKALKQQLFPSMREKDSPPDHQLSYQSEEDGPPITLRDQVQIHSKKLLKKEKRSNKNFLAINKMRVVALEQKRRQKQLQLIQRSIDQKAKGQQKKKRPLKKHKKQEDHPKSQEKLKQDQQTLKEEKEILSQDDLDKLNKDQKNEEINLFQGSVDDTRQQEKRQQFQKDHHDKNSRQLEELNSPNIRRNQKERDSSPGQQKQQTKEIKEQEPIKQQQPIKKQQSIKKQQLIKQQQPIKQRETVQKQQAENKEGSDHQHFPINQKLEVTKQDKTIDKKNQGQDIVQPQNKKENTNNQETIKTQELEITNKHSSMDLQKKMLEEDIKSYQDSIRSYISDQEKFDIYQHFIKEHEIESYARDLMHISSDQIKGLNQNSSLEKDMLEAVSIIILIAKDFQSRMQIGIGIFHKQYLNQKYICDYMVAHNMKNFLNLTFNFSRYIFSHDKLSNKIEYFFDTHKLEDQLSIKHFSEFQQKCKKLGEVFMKSGADQMKKYVLRRNLFEQVQASEGNKRESQGLEFNLQLRFHGQHFKQRGYGYHNVKSPQFLSINVLAADYIRKDEERLEKFIKSVESDLDFRQLLITTLMFKKKQLQIKNRTIKQIPTEQRISISKNFIKSFNIQDPSHMMELSELYISNSLPKGSKRSTFDIDNKQINYILHYPEGPISKIQSSNSSEIGMFMGLIPKYKVLFINGNQFISMNKVNPEMNIFFYVKHFIKNIFQVQRQAHPRVFIPQFEEKSQIFYNSLSSKITGNVFASENIKVGWHHQFSNSIMFAPSHKDLVIKKPFIIAFMSSTIEKVIEGTPVCASLIE